MLVEYEPYHGLGMDAPVIPMRSNMNAIMVGVGTRTLLWFGRGSAQNAFSETTNVTGWGMDALLNVCSWNTISTLLWLGRG